MMIIIIIIIIIIITIIIIIMSTLANLWHLQSYRSADAPPQKETFDSLQ